MTMFDSNAYIANVRRRGFSLIETTMATLMVSILLVSAISGAALVAKGSAVRRQADTATRIFQLLSAEIHNRPFQQPGSPNAALGRDGEPGSPRVSWDDFDDYGMWQTSQVTDETGTSIPGAEGWQLAGTVDYCSPLHPTVTNIGVTELKKLTLTLTSPTGIQFTQTLLRSKHGLWQEAQAPGTHTITSVTVKATAGESLIEMSARNLSMQGAN